MDATIDTSFSILSEYNLFPIPKKPKVTEDDMAKFDPKGATKVEICCDVSCCYKRYLVTMAILITLHSVLDWYKRKHVVENSTATDKCDTGHKVGLRTDYPSKYSKGGEGEVICDWCYK